MQQSRILKVKAGVCKQIGGMCRRPDVYLRESVMWLGVWLNGPQSWVVKGRRAHYVGGKRADVWERAVVRLVRREGDTSSEDITTHSRL